MKKLALVVIFALLIVANKLLACSVSVNDNFQKNLLVAQAASHLDLALTGVSQSALADYGKSFIGEDAYHCPLYLQTSARISFKYSPKKFENCDASVVVVHRQYMGAELPSGPIEQVEFSEEQAACSTSFPHPIPRPRPIPCIPGRTC